jgi:hypothetical protein
VHAQWSPAEIQTPTQWNLIGSSMTVPVSSPSIIPPQSSHYAPFPARKKLARASKFNFFIFFSLYFLKIC